MNVYWDLCLSGIVGVDFEDFFKKGGSSRSSVGLSFFLVYLLNSFNSPLLERVERVLLGG